MAESIEDYVSEESCYHSLPVEHAEIANLVASLGDEVGSFAVEDGEARLTVMAGTQTSRLMLTFERGQAVCSLRVWVAGDEMADEMGRRFRESVPRGVPFNVMRDENYLESTHFSVKLAHGGDLENLVRASVDAF